MTGIRFRPVSRIIAYVAGPGPLVASIQASVSEEARKRGLVAEDALLLFPPTRTYTNAEIQAGIAGDGIDGVLLINVGDTGIMQQYAGTILSGQYSGSSSASGMLNTFGNLSNVVAQWHIVWNDGCDRDAHLSLSEANVVYCPAA